MNITLDTELDDLIEGLKVKSKKNIEYIKKNYKEIIQNEIECIELAINEGTWSRGVVRDNQGEINYTNDNGKEIGNCSYWATIS